MTDPQFALGLLTFTALIALTLSQIVTTLRLREVTEELDELERRTGYQP